MKRAAAIAFLLTIPTAAFAEGATRRVIVVTRHPYSQAVTTLRGDDFDPANRIRYNAQPFKYINGFAADLDESEIRALKRSPEVAWIEDTHEVHAFADDAITPGEQTTPYGVKMVNAPAVWPVTKGRSLDAAKPTRVAIIDTGIDYTSAELSAAYKGGRNFVLGNDDPLDDAGHGSHVAGTIAAADNGAGVVGIAPQAEIYSLKVLDSCGSGLNSDVLAALDWVREKKKAIGGNWIINLSLGAKGSSAAERQAFQAASDDGILIFAASGNDFSATNPNAIAFPAGYPSVVSVGAIDADSIVASFSQRGPTLKIVAPGVSVLSTVVGEQVSTDDGRHYPALLAGALTSDGTAPADGICIPKPILTGAFVFCNRGLTAADFPESVNGKIALIERGDITFLLKATNAKAAGAVGIIFFDNRPPDAAFGGPGYAVNQDGSFPDLPPTVFITQADGRALKGTPTARLSVGFDNHGFALFNGTSMATPHATGVAVLVWSVKPSASPATISNAMEQTAKDLGAPGVDNTFGFGLINALDAAKQVNPDAFNTPPGPPSGRTPGRRGH